MQIIMQMQIKRLQLAQQMAKDYARLSYRLLSARSLCNKLIDFQHLLSTEHLDNVAVNETWLNNSIPDELIVDSNSSFSIYRKDILTHGGVGFV